VSQHVFHARESESEVYFIQSSIVQEMKGGSEGASIKIEVHCTGEYCTGRQLLPYGVRGTFFHKRVPGFCTIFCAHGFRTPQSCVAWVLSCTGLTPITPPSHNPPMRNKTWRFTMLSRMMKYFQNGTTTYIGNGLGGILDGYWMGGTPLQSFSEPISWSWRLTASSWWH
jgi:hypothetical protein